MPQFASPYDNNLLLKDSYAVTATAVAQVASANVILDLGPGRVEGKVMRNVTAIKTSATDELYLLRLQFSNSASFASSVTAQHAVPVGAAAVTSNTTSTAVGLFETPFVNEINGTIYRYARESVVVSGTSPTITHTAWITKED